MLLTARVHEPLPCPEKEPCLVEGQVIEVRSRGIMIVRAIQVCRFKRLAGITA